MCGDAQSIYGFRGADFENIHSFKERIPDAVIHTLDLNYRSTQEILDLSNWLLAHSQSIIKTVTGTSWQRTKATTPFVW